MTGFRVPAATYRFQFHQNFNLAAAQALVPYLSELGITHLYSSPLFRARRGSLHGYSVTNPLELNPELGAKVAFEALIRKLKSKGMGLILDIVPNHMAMSRHNPWWMDVLESGPASLYAIFFDIDWEPPQKILAGRLLLPVLGKPLGEALEAQELTLQLGEDGFSVHYYNHQFPVAPKTSKAILEYRLQEVEKEIGGGNPAFLALMGLVSMMEHIPARTVTSPKKLRERHREKEALKERLWLLYQGSPEIKDFLDTNIKIFNGTPGDPRSFDLLEKLLDEQPYRLAFWQVALEMINYRRFFSINDLICMRVEDAQVFEATHGLLLNLLADGKISGLRIDHIDGLYDPAVYLQRLQNRLAQGEAGIYIVVEKILAEDEPLPADWPVAGTTGYDFLDLTNGLFVDDKGLQELQTIYAAFTGTSVTLDDVVYDKKKLILKSLFGGEVESLEHYLVLLAEQDRLARDVSQKELFQAMVETIACLPIYRTYIRNFQVPARDLAYLEKTMAEVRRRNPFLDPAALDFLRRVLCLDFPPTLPEEQQEAWLRFVMRFQQFTGPIMAKGLEDTALYVYNPLISLNEVGGSFRGLSPQAFHQFNRTRLASWPFTLNASSTHDTKRSEDVRARIHVLSELADEWDDCLRRWSRWNRPKKVMVHGLRVPDPNLEIFLYQTLLGAWPLFPEEMPQFKERLRHYMIKAAREAKVHTRWISPNQEHEQALLAFVDAILRESDYNEFLKDFRKFQARLAYYGALNSLSQVLLKITSPGVPDFYQGTELWDFSLVDPDNRRAVDFPQRVRHLKELKRKKSKKPGALASQLLSNWEDGRLKLLVICQALNFRKNNLKLFLEGEYLPLTPAGDRRQEVVAFARRHGKDWALAAVGRFFTRIAPFGEPPTGERGWGNSTLELPRPAPSRWLNVLSGETLEASGPQRAKTLALPRIFQSLPVALLWGTAR